MLCLERRPPGTESEFPDRNSGRWRRKSVSSGHRAPRQQYKHSRPFCSRLTLAHLGKKAANGLRGKPHYSVHRHETSPKQSSEEVFPSERAGPLYAWCRPVERMACRFCGGAVIAGALPATSDRPFCRSMPRSNLSQPRASSGPMTEAHLLTRRAKPSRDYQAEALHCARHSSGPIVSTGGRRAVCCASPKLNLIRSGFSS